MYKIGEDEMVSCPYNPCHVVKKLRIQKHIVKCKKNNPQIKLTPCLYNYSHRLRPGEKLEHLKVCSHKARLEAGRYCVKSNFTSDTSQEIRKPEIFCTKPLPNTVHYMYWKNFRQSTDMSSSDFDSSDEELEIESEDSEAEAAKKISGGTPLTAQADSSTEDDDLEPLPLPKTHSKAFILAKQRQADRDGPSWGRGFGRGKNYLDYSSEKPPRSTDHLLPDVSCSTSYASTATARGVHQSVSESGVETSKMSETFEDSATFKSDSVVFDDDDDDNDNLMRNLKFL